MLFSTISGSFPVAAGLVDVVGVAGFEVDGAVDRAGGVLAACVVGVRVAEPACELCCCG